MSGAMPDKSQVHDLGNVADFLSGGTPSKERDDYWDGDVPWVTARDLKTLFLDDAGLKLTAKGAAACRMAPKGAIFVLVRGMSLFKDLPLALAEREMAFNQDIKALVVKPNFDSLFVAYCLLANKPRIRRLVDTAGHGTGRLDTDLLKAVPLRFPTKEVQQKIANGCRSLDRKIALLEEKKAALTEYKRGLMQRLFSGELRFTRDDGSAFPEWQERRLGDVADIIGGGTPESDKAEYWNGDIIWFTPSEIKSKYLADSERHISKSGLKNSSAKLLPVGALVLSTRATVGELGIATRPCATNQGFQSLLIRAPHFNEFWYYWVGAHKREFLRRAAGSTFLEIGKTELAKIPVEIPHPDEQRKIAGALSALDAKIDATARKISEMETFKKGLLQKLFV